MARMRHRNSSVCLPVIPAIKGLQALRKRYCPGPGLCSSFRSSTRQDGRRQDLSILNFTAILLIKALQPLPLNYLAHCWIPNRPRVSASDLSREQTH